MRQHIAGNIAIVLCGASFDLPQPIKSSICQVVMDGPMISFFEAGLLFRVFEAGLLSRVSYNGLWPMHLDIIADLQQSYITMS